MEEHKKWECINSAETTEELQEAILAISEDGKIQGRTKYWVADKQAKHAKLVITEGFRPNLLTRSYGIRQQAIYIRFYESIENK